jgi:5-formyltetrahydrofolate cyclo-ligase
MVQQGKKNLRREMKLVLSNLDKRWTSRAHAEVCHHLNSLVSALAKQDGGTSHVLAWIPCFPGEIDLAGFIGEMIKSSGVYLPRLDRDGVMSFAKIGEDWGAQLEQGPRGIVQTVEGYGQPFDFPKTGRIYVIIPGLAFDQRGGRLGRGAGHYDRFLAHPELGPVTKIGVCWSMQLVQEIPMDSHDVLMDWICHERGTVPMEYQPHE